MGESSDEQGPSLLLRPSSPALSQAWGEPPCGQCDVGWQALDLLPTVSFPFPDTDYRQLTLNNDVLTCLLVPLTVATDLVGQAIALMVEGLAALKMRDTLPQLALDKRRSVPGR